MCDLQQRRVNGDFWCRFVRWASFHVGRLSESKDTLTNVLKLKLLGVPVGTGCRFSGSVNIKRFPGSTIRIGERCNFKSRCGDNRLGINRPCMLTTLTPNAVLSIGNAVGLSGVTILAARSVLVEDNVLIGANVTIMDTDCHCVAPEARLAAPTPRPVIIRQNVWLGLNVIILKGVTLGENTVVGAGSVVRESMPENVICSGQPAKIIKRL